MKRFVQLTILALLASLAVGVQDSMASCLCNTVESGRYYDSQPVGPNNISNIRGVKARFGRVNSASVPDYTVAKAYIQVIEKDNFGEVSRIEFGYERSMPPGSNGPFNCANTPNTQTGDAYPTSRVVVRWYDYPQIHDGCLYGQEITDGEYHDYRLQRCSPLQSWCAYLDGVKLWDIGSWGSVMGEQADEIRIASELNCNFAVPGTAGDCHGPGTTWYNRFGGSLNWSVTNETAEQSPSWWNEHSTNGVEAVKQNTPSGYWVIENISTTAAWDIYHVGA